MKGVLISVNFEYKGTKDYTLLENIFTTKMKKLINGQSIRKEKNKYQQNLDWSIK